MFRDRVEAGRILGRELKGVVEFEQVYAIAPTGIPVAYGVVLEAGGCMDIIAVGEVTDNDIVVAGVGFTSDVLVYDTFYYADTDYTLSSIKSEADNIRPIIIEKIRRYRGSLEYDVASKVLVVDEGIATGYSMAAAVQQLKALGAKEVIAAAPTASIDGAIKVAMYAPTYVLNLIVGSFYAIADAYQQWSEVVDSDVYRILGDARRRKLLCYL